MDKNRWKLCYGEILDKLLQFGMRTSEDVAKELQIDKSTISFWRRGKRLPRSSYTTQLEKYLHNISINENLLTMFSFEIERIAYKVNLISQLYEYRVDQHDNIEEAIYLMILCYQRAKGRWEEEKLVGRENLDNKEAIKVMVMSFEVLIKNTTISVWEEIWKALGYKAKVEQKLQVSLIQKEITYEEWCKQIEEKFKRKNLNKKVVEQVADNIELLPGVEEVLKRLKDKDIKVYIVSGSVNTVVFKCLGSLAQYVDEIKANQFDYNRDTGMLERIVATKYDYEGKVEFVKQILQEFELGEENVLFVGNSVGDKFVYKSGVRTLCVNPCYADISNKEIWNNCILRCENFNEIMEYVY